MNREAWLTMAIDRLWDDLFLTEDMVNIHGHSVLPKIAVSVGWASANARKKWGECWPLKAGAGTSQIFISPMVDDPVRALATVVHELIHALDDCESGHKGAFAKLARLVGLEGKLTATHAGPDLEEKLARISRQLGPYPHGGMNPNAREEKKQSTRMIKVICREPHSAPNEDGDEIQVECGYTVRTTRRWIDFGLPTCPCGGEMELADPDQVLDQE